MLEVFCLHDSHDGCNAHTVVRTKGSAIGINPTVLDDSFDRIGFEVVLTVWCFLWYHIHVCLEGNSFAVLHSRSSRLAHYDVAGWILKGFYANFLGKVEKELLNFFYMS